MKKTLQNIALITFSLLSISFTTAHASDFGTAAFNKASFANFENLEGRLNSYVLLAIGMRNYITPHEYEVTYLPLKRLAAIAKIDCRIYGPLSQTTHNDLSNLVSFVANHQQEFGTLWEIESFFDTAQDLMALTESLAKDLR